jgi:hypothetical protein
VSELDLGANRHIWETRLASLDEELASEPVDSLGELLALVEEMLDAAGFETGATPVAADPELVAVLERARELVSANDFGAEVRHDDAQQTAAELRTLCRGLLEHAEADLGADLATRSDGA